MNHKSRINFVPYMQREILSQINQLKSIISVFRGLGNNNDESEQDISSDAEINKWEKIIEEERNKVEQLHLTLAFVGTMKAGKSMIINSIIGSKILPSRNTPMTTLPTIITHKPGQKEPVLNLQNPLPFNKAITSIKEILKNKDKNSYQEINGYYLLTDDIKTTLFSICDISIIEQSYIGKKDIHSVLILLNDVTRICKAFELENPLKHCTKLEHFPNITIEFSYLNNRTEERGGTLSLIDSPGPNEAGQNLQEIVEKVLSDASSVVGVIDYTQLGSKAERDIQISIRSIQRLAKSRLFVLVNKFDQETNDSLNEEKTINYIHEKLFPREGIDGEVLSVQGRAYPISAKSGFFANMAKRAMINDGMLPDPSIEDWVEDFGRLAYATRAKSFLKKLDDEQHIHASDDLWEDSKMGHPMEEIITNSLKQAVPLSLGSALSKISSINSKMGSNLELIDSSIKQEISNLNESLKRLSTRLKMVEAAENELVVLKQEILSNTRKQTQSAFRQWERQARNTVEDWYKSVAKNLDKPSKNVPLFQYFGFDVLFNLLFPEKTLELVRERLSTREFTSEQEAKEFLNAIFTQLSFFIRDSLETEVSKLNTMVNEAQNKLDLFIKDKVNHIIEEEKEDLKNSFNVDIKIPQPSLTKIELSLERIERAVINPKEVDITYTYETLERKWYTLWLVDHNITKKGTKKETIYTIDPGQVRAALIDNIDNTGDIITAQVNSYIADIFQQNIDSFFSDLVKLFQDIKINIEKGKKIKQENDEIKQEIYSNIKSMQKNIVFLDKRTKDTKRGVNEYFNIY
ncbi:dynamin family protein [Nostoc sp. UHCC 0870]